MDHSHHHAIAEFSYWLAFMTGVLGSGHCLGMCGGLVSSFFIRLGDECATAMLRLMGKK